MTEGYGWLHGKLDPGHETVPRRRRVKLNVFRKYGYPSLGYQVLEIGCAPTPSREWKDQALIHNISAYFIYND